MNKSIKELTRREFIVLGIGSMTYFAMRNNSLFAAENKKISFQWFGQACFLITTSKGTKILMDPVFLGDYKVPKSIKPDIVTVFT